MTDESSDDPLLTVEGFEARFRGDVQVLLNWERFLAERWPIERVEIRDAGELAAVEAPWYLDGDGHPCDLSSAKHRLRLGEIPELFDELGQSPDLMRRYAGEWQGAGVAVSQMPAYSLGDSRALLLDGTHRGVGALLAGVPIEIDLYVVRGPLDPDCLADLRVL